MTTVANLTRQALTTLYLQRSSEAVLDVRQYLVRRERLGAPQSAGEVFELLVQASWVEPELAA